ncbi:MAG: hypothetical protein RLZZ200_2672 [Pseudomonadota bacterium]|jgi:cholesterol transport system auxiliary component
MSPRVTATLFLSLALAGCGGLTSRSPVEQLYVLHPAAEPVEGPVVAATLQVLRPVAQAGLDTSRIALVQPGNRLDYFAGGRWAGPLEQVVESMLVQTLRGSGRFAQVASDGAGMGADLVLAVTVRRFEADYAGVEVAPVAKVRLECTLSSRRTHAQVAGFDIETSVAAGANRLGSVVAALEKAAQDATRQLVRRVAEIGPGPVSPAR